MTIVRVVRNRRPGQGGGGGDPLSQPLLQASDLDYLGYFQADLSGANSGFDAGGATLAVNGSTLYLGGNAQQTLLGRLTIPNEPFTGQTASVIQQPVDTNADAGGTGELPFQTGAMVYDAGGGKRVYVQAARAYDAQTDGSNIFTSAALNLTGFTAMQAGSFSDSTNWRYYNGFMGEIADEWKSLFGGPCLAGNCQQSNNASCSAGPACGVFDPAQIDGSGSVTITPVTHWHYTGPHLDNFGVANDLLALADQYMAGIAFPSGYRTILFVGRHGYGTPDYKNENGPPGDPCDPDNGGEQAYPYRFQGWFFDAAEALDAKNGLRAYNSLTPEWADLTPPDMSECVELLMGSATYDHASRRLFVAEQGFWPGTIKIFVWHIPEPS